MRLIDVDVLIDDVMKRYCEECNKRRGIKDGKWRVVYEIGDAPCRACEVDDMKVELDEAPTIEAEPIVRCKDCRYWEKVNENVEYGLCRGVGMFDHSVQIRERNFYCADGEKR